MKSCCNVNDERQKSNSKKYFNWIVYLVLLTIIGFALYQ